MTRRTPLVALLLPLATALGLGAEPPQQSDGPKGSPKSQPAPPPGVEVIHNVEIGQGGSRALHAEIARPLAAPSTPMPAVLWIHGGGWSGGTHKSSPAIWLATKGYFTASIEYRLSGEAPWPAQIEDCKLALRWLRANAANLRASRLYLPALARSQRTAAFASSICAGKIASPLSRYSMLATA